MRLLQQKDIEEITITELCREAGINRATFYRHYDAPADLLMEITLDESQNVQGFFRTPMTIETAREDMAKMCAYLYSRADLYRTLTRNHSDEDLIAVFDRICSDIIDCMRASEIPGGLDSEDVRLSATFMGGGAYFMFRRWLTEDIAKTPQQVADLMMRFIDKDVLLHWANDAK